MENNTTQETEKKPCCCCSVALGGLVILFAWWDVAWGAIALTVLGVILILKELLGRYGCCSSICKPHKKP